MPDSMMFLRSADGINYEPCDPQNGYANAYNVVVPEEIGNAIIGAADKAEAYDILMGEEGAP